MHDTFGRDVTYLRLSVTDLCNCRCVYCMPACGVPRLRHEDILSFEQMRQIVVAAASLGVRKVRLTGGEPLVRRNIVELVRMVASVPGVDEVDMTTNATLLAPVAAELRAAGLTRLNVSLDTLDAERYRKITRVGTLEDALAGLAAAREAGFSGTKVNCVLLGGINQDELRPLAELARTRELSVRFIELMPMGTKDGFDIPLTRAVARAVPIPVIASGGVGKLEHFAEGIIDGEADAVLAAVPELEPVASATQGVAELFCAPGWRGTVGLIRPMTHRFCGQCNRIRVTADGRLKPCLHSAAEVDLRGLSGKDLVQAIARGIAAKPGRHHMDMGHASQTPRAMSQIGG